MKRLKSIICSAGVVLAVAGVNSTAARADIVVDVYEYAGKPTIGTDANATTLGNILAAGPANYTHYEFTYTGLNNIVWVAGAGTANLGSDFVNVADITSFSGGFAAQNAFLASTLSNSGDSKTAFFDIHGLISGTILSGVVTHDDGATFIIGGTTQFSQAPETNSEDGIVGPGTYAGTPFNLYYVEGNGPPAVLEVKLNGTNLT